MADYWYARGLEMMKAAEANAQHNPNKGGFPFSWPDDGDSYRDNPPDDSDTDELSFLARRIFKRRPLPRKWWDINPDQARWVWVPIIEGLYDEIARDGTAYVEEYDQHNILDALAEMIRRKEELSGPQSRQATAVKPCTIPEHAAEGCLPNCPGRWRP